MAAWRSIEEESGIDVPRPRHEHNGYYAGDFSNQPLRLLTYRNGQWVTKVVWPTDADGPLVGPTSSLSA